MKKFIEKCKILLHIKKPEPWYKKYLKKCGLILDMKRRNKFITFFLLLFISVYFCMPSVETIVKKAVHKFGSEITGTEVTLNGLDLKLTSGEGHVKGIKVGNPKGYSSKNLFQMKDIGIKINIPSLAGDTVVIESIDIDNPLITYEMQSLSQNNISEILQNIKLNTAQSEKNLKNQEKKQKDSKTKKIIIKNLTIRNGEVQVIAGMGKSKKPIIVSLPDISMQNIGERKNGASIGETITKIMTHILQITAQTVLNADIKDLPKASLQKVKSVTRNVQNEAKKTTAEIQAESQQATQKAQKAVKELTNSLGGVFK